MKLSYNRLKCYVDICAGVEATCEALVCLGFEVEGVERVGFSGSGPIVFGQVISKNIHPNADRLSVCNVSIGSSELQIVCGAKNFTAGDFVAVALPGATVGGTVLKNTKMRGVESNGMMCSAVELGLSTENADGLIILNDFDAKLGSQISSLFEEPDAIIDISITPNRGDCLSYLGIARELAAYFEKNLIFTKTNNFANASKSSLSAQILDSDCSRYCGAKISNVAIDESPAWLKLELEKLGFRPKNVIVDLTNFVMLELGQPLHAFDACRISGQKIFVRKATYGECFVGLDGKTYSLLNTNTVVADSEKSIAIAGIIGGKNTEISPSTKAIFLESANFIGESIKKSTKALGVSTESSYRFERNVDVELASCAVERFVELLRKIQPNISIEACDEFRSSKCEKYEISCDFTKINKLLGFCIRKEDFENILKRLNFNIVSSNDKMLVSVPSYRACDVTTEAALVEEFLRIYGTSKIVSSLPLSKPSEAMDDNIIKIKRQYGEILSTLGFYECYTDSLQPLSLYEGHSDAESMSKLCVSNPLNMDHEVLRQSLIPGILEVLKSNKNNGNAMSRAFEIGNVFKIIDGEICELFAATFLLKSAAGDSFCKAADASIDDIKSVIESLLPSTGMPKSAIQSAQKFSSSFWQSDFCGRFGSLQRSGVVCEFGYISTSFAKNWLKDDVVLGCEIIAMPEKLKCCGIKQFEAFSDLPKVRRDLSILVAKDTLAEDVRKRVEVAAKKSISGKVELNSVRIFDVYFSNNSDEKSISIAITFGSNDFTLTDAEIGPAFDNIQKILERENLKIRKQCI